VGIVGSQFREGYGGCGRLWLAAPAGGCGSLLRQTFLLGVHVQLGVVLLGDGVASISRVCMTFSPLILPTVFLSTYAGRLSSARYCTCCLDSAKSS